MLYRPKFCSPSMAAEQKCFKYNEDNNYIFSCVCDGDEKIVSATINFRTPDDTDDMTILGPRTVEYTIPKYPIDNKGQYRIFEFTGIGNEDPVLYNNTHFFWTVTLEGDKGSKVTSFEQETFIANPSIQWTNAENNTIIEFKQIEDTPHLIDTNKIHIKSNLDDNYPYKVQYWYYKIYERSSNTLVYESKKIFSQEIDFVFDQFINDITYRVELYILDTVNQEWKTENYFKSNYDIYENSAKLDYKLMPFDSGVYLQWSNISMNMAQPVKETEDGNFITIKETGNSSIINTQQAYRLCGDNRLVLTNINLYTKGIYGCLRIPEYNSSNNNYCNLSVYEEENLNEPKAQLVIIRQTEENIAFKTTNSTGGTVKINNDNSPAWVCFYWDFLSGKVAAKMFSSENQVSITTDLEILENDDFIVSAGLYNKSVDIAPNIQLPTDITVNKLDINGVGVEVAYLFAVKPDADEIAFDENNKIENTTILEYLDALNVQPFWNYGLAALDKVEVGGKITHKYSSLANQFVFCLNFENFDLYKNSEGNWSFADKSPYLLGDPIYKQKIKQMVVKRKEKKETYFKTIATIDYDYTDENSDNLKIVAYSARSGKSYEYVLFPVGENQQYQSPIHSNPVEVDWVKWTLMLCDETDVENELILNQVFLFDLNLKSGSMNNNNKKTLIENFTPYPRIQSSPSCFWSGSLSGLLGYIGSDATKYNQTPEMLQIFKNLSLNRQRKFLKDRDGNLFEVEISNPLSIDNTDNLMVDIKSKSIQWVEVGNADNISITLRANQVPHWLEVSSDSVGRTEIQWLQNNYWIGDVV